jgi:glycosyltransferase involved in cell wall biosynthesis
MTVIEAASLGRPIVMTDVGCANEFLINEKSGLIVGTRDVESMTSALERLYENRAFATNLGLEAKRWADIYMTPKESDELMLELWKRAL